MILLLDNYDSFTYNLVQALRGLGAAVEVRRNDALSVADAVALAPRALVVSPGPGVPSEAGITLALIRRFLGWRPILGVCLGHQALGEALGARLVPAPEPRHGKASPIVHQQSGLFATLPQPLAVGRYHSLVLERASLPPELEVTAASAEGTVMAVAHRRLPAWGVQFHPESVLTPHGPELLANFLGLAAAAPPGGAGHLSSQVPER